MDKPLALGGIHKTFELEDCNELVRWILSKNILSMVRLCFCCSKYYLESETCIYKWLFQLDEPNLYIGNGCFTKHPFKTGCLGFQVVANLYLDPFYRGALNGFCCCQRTSKPKKTCVSQHPWRVLMSLCTWRSKAVGRYFPEVIRLLSILKKTWTSQVRSVKKRHTWTLDYSYDLIVISLHKLILLMAEIPNNHLGCIKRYKQWDKLPPRRISEPSTVVYPGPKTARMKKTSSQYRNPSL